MASKTTVVFHFIIRIEQSNAPLPPDGHAEHRRDKRYHDENDPAHITECGVAQTEGESLGNFWCDADELLATEQPVHAPGNEIEGLLFLRERVVLNEGGVAHQHHARGIHLHALIAAAALLDRNSDVVR